MMAFSSEFQTELLDLMRWRRDVRRFRSDPVDDALLRDCLEAMRLAPSVGLSEPWRVISVQSETAHDAMLANFQAENADALADYDGERAETYAGLKLSGMREAPVQLAVFCDEDTSKGGGLGVRTMTEMRRYSVVTAIMNLWLFARAQGLGVGWVSILDAEQAKRDLDAPDGWALVAYLCVGWPEETHTDPELQRAGWEQRSDALEVEVR